MNEVTVDVINDKYKKTKRINIRLRVVSSLLLVLTMACFVGLVLTSVRNHDLEQENTRLRNQLNIEEVIKPTEEPENHIQVVTTREIESQLEQIGELATCTQIYTNQKSLEDTRDVWIFSDMTKKTIDVIYQGIVKVGYDVEAVQVELDNTNYIIKITLPEARVLDNYVILDSVQCLEDNNALNPIAIADFFALMEGSDDDGLKCAEEAGIYGKADKQIKHVIENFLAVFSDYTIEFQ